ALATRPRPRAAGGGAGARGPGASTGGARATRRRFVRGGWRRRPRRARGSRRRCPRSGRAARRCGGRGAPTRAARPPNRGRRVRAWLGDLPPAEPCAFVLPNLFRSFGVCALPLRLIAQVVSARVLNALARRAG